MTALATGTNEYLEDFERFEKRGGGNPAWMAPIRKAAISRFAEMGFPTTRDEEWRFTNVAPIAGAVFRRVEPAPPPGREAVSPFLLGAAARNRLVFVNGHFAPQLSQTACGPDGVCATNLHRTPGREADILAAHLTRYADFRRHPFTALNTAFFEDGAFVRVPGGRSVEEPIHLLFLS
ncbi:MAG: Fe-S cluster assembly protein SufD, partial [Phycisphaerae bacterium]